MQRISRRIWQMILFVGLLIISITSTANIQAQTVSFSMDKINLEGNITSEGHLNFRETYTYKVDFMNGMYVIIDHDQHTLSNYRVGILNDDGSINYLTEGRNDLPNTYRTSEEGDLLKFQIFYPAQNETVNVVVEYTINNIVTNYQDTAELNWKLTGVQYDNSYDYSARIYLPGEVTTKEDFRAWGHGHYLGEVYPITQDGRSYIDVTVPNNPPGTPVELHAIFPTSLTPNNTNVVPEAAKQRIIDAENEQVESDRLAYEQAAKERLRWLIPMLLSPVATLVTFIYYIRNRRKFNPNPVHIPEHMYSLPEDITPAIMATTVLRDEPTPDDFSATILDLARKDYIDIEGFEIEAQGLLRNKRTQTVRISPKPDISENKLNEMLRHERHVYDYLLPDGEPMILNELQKRVKSDRNTRKEKNRLWRQFSNYVSSMGEKRRNTPEAKNVAKMFSIVSTLISIFVMIVAPVIMLDTPLEGYLSYVMIAAMINVIIAVILVVIASARPIVSAEEDRQQKEWKAFANMLDNVGNMNMREVASLPLWEEFLVYAVSLGVADKVIEAMNKNYSFDEIEANTHMPTVFYNNPYWINRVIRDSMSDSIQASTPSTSTSSYKGTNIGGFGGGFSGGSSGGGGGGGGAGGF